MKPKAPTSSRQKRERRGFSRTQVDHVRLLAPCVGTVLDVSPRGLRAETSECLPIGRDCVITLGEVGYSARVPCRVLWCRLAGTEKTAEGNVRPIYRLGVRFLGH
ncbi:MAG: PilZ domain-containing protein [Acidobacteriota bacterium]|nr:PilZ domain-containing protein [Acidobacteriota bacterium]